MIIETAAESNRAALSGADLLRNSFLMEDRGTLKTREVRELVIADTDIEDAALLLDQLQPGIELWRVDARSDFADTLRGALSGGYETLHFLGHGHSGSIILGGREFDVEDFTAISIGEDARRPSLHFWSCMTGAGVKGRAFVDGIARAFGTVVTAFSGLVGVGSKGGSWLPDVFSMDDQPVACPFVNALAYAHTLQTNVLGFKSVVTGTGVDVQIWLKGGTVVDAADLVLSYEVAKASYTGAVANSALLGWIWIPNQDSPGHILVSGYSLTQLNSAADILLETVSFSLAQGSSGFSVSLLGGTTLTNSLSTAPQLGTLPTLTYTSSVAPAWDPLFFPPSNLSYTAGTTAALDFAVQATDPNGDALTYKAVVGQLNGASVFVPTAAETALSSAGGHLTGSLALPGQAGNYVFRLYADDDTADTNSGTLLDVPFVLTSGTVPSTDFISIANKTVQTVGEHTYVTFDVCFKEAIIGGSKIEGAVIDLKYDYSVVDPVASVVTSAAYGGILNKPVWTTILSNLNINGKIAMGAAMDASNTIVAAGGKTITVTLVVLGVVSDFAVSLEAGNSVTLLRTADQIEYQFDGGAIVVPPASLADVVVDLMSSSDSGTLDTDNITNVTSPVVEVNLTGKTLTESHILQVIDTSNSNAVVGTYTITAQDVTNGLASKDITLSTLSGGTHTLKAQFSNSSGAAGITSTTATTVTVDTTAPTTIISGLALSADTGTSATDFITSTATQTISGILSAALGTGEKLYGSVDNGTTWVDITSKVSATAISWDGATLSGSSTIKLEVRDAAGNSGTAVSHAYVLDTAVSNSHAPVFTSGSTGSVDENAVTSTVIYTAATTDADNPATPPGYALGGADAALLNITTAGAVTLKASADYETKTSYSFNVIAHDGDAAHDTTQAVVVSVNNLNDTSPATSALLLKSVVTGTGVDIQVWLAAGTVIDNADLVLSYDITKANVTGAVSNPALAGWNWLSNPDPEFPGHLLIAALPPYNSATQSFGSIHNSTSDTLLETISFTLLPGSNGFSASLVSGTGLSNGDLPVELGPLPTIVQSPAGYNLTVHTNYWNNDNAMHGVTIDSGSLTDNLGAAILNNLPSGTKTLIPALTASQADKAAVDLLDAIAILKSIVGLTTFNIYQQIAADFDSANGVDLNDAIGILKHVVGLPAATPEWVFVDQVDTTPNPVDPIHVMVAANTAVDLMGVLRGDVDGSWAN